MQLYSPSFWFRFKVPPETSSMSLSDSSGVLTPGDRVVVEQGTSHTFTCLVQGTRPSVTIEWFLNDVPRSTVDPTPGGGGDELVNTTGDWSFAPTRDDHRQVLRCVASTAESQDPRPSVTVTLDVNGMSRRIKRPHFPSLPQ